MKTHIKHIILGILLLLQVVSYGQNNNIKGYKIQDETIIFTFNVNDYPNIKNNGQFIEDVFISGEFNNWAKDQWKMIKVNDSIYELQKQLSDFTDEFDWEFKYIVNKEHWAEPDSNFENITVAKDKYGRNLHVYNLKMYTAFVSDYGNVSFKLDGYKNAKKIILSGSFNRWNEESFKMRKNDNGWNLTLQLKPSLYEYKFIVDGKWIIDPRNPSKKRNEYNGYNSLIDVKKNVTFKLKNFKKAEKVILSGDFNDWSKKGFQMLKTDNGWEYSINLSGGKYHYKFIVDGKWITDPDNSVIEYDYEGNINSVCMVK